MIYNSKGKGEILTLEDIDGENLTSLDKDKSEKLLRVYVSNDFDWKTRVDKVASDVNKRMGMMRRMRNKVLEENY